MSDKTAQASKELALSAEQVSISMEQGTKANEDIALNATNALERCEENLKYVEDSSITIVEISMRYLIFTLKAVIWLKPLHKLMRRRTQAKVL